MTFCLLSKVFYPAYMLVLIRERFASGYMIMLKLGYIRRVMTVERIAVNYAVRPYFITDYGN